MKTMTTALIALVCGTIAVAQPPAAPPDPQPGKEHQYLQKNLGPRTGTMKIFLGGPDDPPIEAPFRENNKVLLNGFWVESDFESGPYKGRGTYGFDPNTKKYVGTWISNQTPHMSIMRGTYNADKHELTMTFKDYDHATGALTDHKSVTSDAPGKPETFTMYKKDAKSKKWVKVFILDYAPKKATQ